MTDIFISCGFSTWVYLLVNKECVVAGMEWITENERGVILQVKVVPRGSSNRVEGLLGDALKVRLQAPPVDGKANKELRKFLSKQLKVPASCIELLTGDTSRNKRLILHGVKKAYVRDALGL